jgi:hypothetical protein
MTVQLGDGLEEIGEMAFYGCASLQRIVIPQSVTAIHEEAFGNCFDLASVVFCDEIEEFVSCDSIGGWWNHGAHKRAPRTYCFLKRCNIPERLCLVRPKKWQTSIHGMLSRIPVIPPRALNSYFDSIDAKLSTYERFEDTPMVLELAIWKSKIVDQYDGNLDYLTTKMKVQCRTDSLVMVNIIVQNVLLFLTCVDVKDHVVNADDDYYDYSGYSVADSDDDDGSDDGSDDDDESDHESDNSDDSAITSDDEDGDLSIHTGNMPDDRGSYQDDLDEDEDDDNSGEDDSDDNDNDQFEDDDNSSGYCDGDMSIDSSIDDEKEEVFRRWLSIYDPCLNN